MTSCVLGRVGDAEFMCTDDTHFPDVVSSMFFMDDKMASWKSPVSSEFLVT